MIYRSTIAGLDLEFEDMNTPHCSTWLITGDHIQFFMRSEDGRYWEFQGKVSPLIQEMKPQLVHAIRSASLAKENQQK